MNNFVHYKNIVLIGMSGVGKTVVGKYIANKLNMEFVDTDDIIISSCGETIDYIFDRYGEQYFRDLEVKVIKEFSSKKGIVISTGGGVILNFKNIERLKRNGMIFLLDANIDTIVSNIQSSNASLENRPLLKDSDYLDCRIKDIYKERKKLYLSSANYIIKVDKKTCENIGNEIIYIYKQVNSCS